MIFKNKEIKELEERLENPNLSEGEKIEIEKQIASLKGKSNFHWGWIIAFAAILLIFVFSKFIGFFINSKNSKPATRKSAYKNVKPARYTASDFIYTKNKTPKKKLAYSKLNSEINVLKNKLKNQKVTQIAGSAVSSVGNSASGKSIVIFVNPEYAQKIKSREGYNKPSPAQITQAALKYPAGSNPYASGYQKRPSGKNILIPEGAVISAYTKYKLYSYNSKVPVIAVVSNPYSFQGKVIIPAGYEFMGSVSGHTKSRLDIRFTQVINPEDGKSLAVDAIAVMPNGSAGVAGNAHYHVVQNVLAGIGSGILGAAAMFAGGGSAMNSSGAYTYQDTLRQNVAQNEVQYAQNSINNAQQSTNQVVITLPAKTAIKIMFLKPLTRK
ncbi:MAG: TrbI/VirB10 family protein [Deltaproteobacteria bacterium]|nr:TrbI/VirB10 family protein [Deltaproteobacteria bacterium]